MRMSKAVFFSELQEGKHDRGAPRKCYRDQLKRQLAQAGISHGSRPQTETVGSHQREKPVASLRQKGMQLQRKDAGGRKSEQPPNHPEPKPLPVQSAVGGAHQESVSTATNEHARIDHQPSQQSSSARNEP